MISPRILVIALSLGIVPLSSLGAEDLSSYRAFRLGMTLPAVARLAGVSPVEARAVYKRPAVIQELEWRPARTYASSTRADPVGEILFSFCDGALYRIVVKYDPGRMEGLTNEDVIEGMSGRYGTPQVPSATIVSSSPAQAYVDNEQVIARWEDQEHSFSLFRFTYQATYGLLILSKRLDAVAQLAVIEAKRLNELEAPQREIDRQKKQEDEKRSAGEKARPANKANFRP